MGNVWLILNRNSELLALPAEHIFAVMVPGRPHVFHSVNHVWGQENMDFSDATRTFSSHFNQSHSVTVGVYPWGWYNMLSTSWRFFIITMLIIINEMLLMTVIKQWKW